MLLTRLNNLFFEAWSYFVHSAWTTGRAGRAGVSFIFFFLSFLFFFFFGKSAVLTYPRFAVRWIYDPVKVTQNKTSLDEKRQGSTINRFLCRAVRRQPRHRALMFEKAWGGGGMPGEK